MEIVKNQDPETINQFIGWVNNQPVLTAELKLERHKLLTMKMKLSKGKGGITKVDNKDEYFNKLKLLKCKARLHHTLKTKTICHEY